MKSSAIVSSERLTSAAFNLSLAPNRDYVRNAQVEAHYISRVLRRMSLSGSAEGSAAQLITNWWFTRPAVVA
jgi:hypothetical protein